VAVFVDHALSARLEAAEAAQLEGLVRTVSARLPDRGTAVASIAGGRAAFLGPHAAISRAAGLGMSGPVTAADVEALEGFYRSRGTEARILVSPFADESLFERLGERGFRLDGLDTLLVRRIEADETFPSVSPAASDVAVHLAAPEDAAAWVHTSLAGFAPPGEPPALDRAAIFEAGFHEPGSAYLAATVAGVVAGGGALHRHGATAHLFAASTLPAFRGRGVQSALIAARLAIGRDAGCDLAFVGTAPGSAAQRNFERWGFAPVYSQALLIKRFD
jgi:GNAT superfamily N-acetyltransferase